MKTLIEDLKKVINSKSKNTDEYLERLINDYIKEKQAEQLRIGAVSICTCGTEEYAENKKREDGFTYCSKCNKKY